MRNVGEEIHLHLGHFLFSLAFVVLQRCELLVQSQPNGETNDEDGNRDGAKCVRQPRLPSEPRRWADNDVEACRAATFYAVAVDGVHAEGVSARRKVGVGGPSEIPDVIPLFLEALELIFVGELLGRQEIDAGIVDGYRGLSVVERDLLGEEYVLLQWRSFSGPDAFVENLQVFDVDSWRVAVGFDVGRVKKGDAVVSGEEYFPVVSSAAGLFVILVARRSVCLEKVLDFGASMVECDLRYAVRSAQPDVPVCVFLETERVVVGESCRGGKRQK